MRRALGLIVGLGCGYLAAWAVIESAFVHQLLGFGLLVWLTSALAFAVAAAVAFLISWRWRR